MDNHSIIVMVQAVAAFVLVLALWMVALLVLRRRRSAERDAIKHRLAGAGDAPAEGAARTLRLFHDGREAVRMVPGLRARLTSMEKLERRCRDAGFKTPPRRLLAQVAGGALLAGVVTLVVTGRIFPALVSMMAVVMVFFIICSKRGDRRARLFERQLVDALELSARALRAGHPLMASFQLISTEIPAPVGTVFASIVQQQALGQRLDESLRRAANDARSPDLDLFAAALSIHSRTGGNLADVMQSLALVIRERLRLGRRFRTLVAQTQVSKRILIAMPIVMFGVLNLISPEYMSELYASSTGQLLMIAAAGSLTCGWFIMNKMANLAG